MKTKTVLSEIITELSDTLRQLDEEQLETLKKYIQKSNKIFVAGAGRSLMMIKGLAMRLMHMGFISHVVGETVTPAIEKGDLLLIASGSGNTATLSVMAEKCKKIGASLALITANPESAVGKIADCIVEVPAASTKIGNDSRKSIQPGANTFEQSVLLIGDAIVTSIVSVEQMEKNNEILMKHHANLE